MLRREIEQRYHAHARHHVAPAPRVGLRHVREVSVDGWRDVDRLGTDTQSIDHQLGVLETRRAGRAIRHPYAKDVLRAERAGREIGRYGGVHATRYADHRRVKAPLAHLLADELREPISREAGVDRE